MKGFRLVLLVLIIVGSLYVAGQSQPQAFGVCKPASEKKTPQEVGCWILGEQPAGRIAQPQAWWQIDTFPTRAAAEAAKGPHGAVFVSMGKVWLLTIERKGWRPRNSGH